MRALQFTYNVAIHCCIATGYSVYWITWPWAGSIVCSRLHATFVFREVRVSLAILHVLRVREACIVLGEKDMLCLYMSHHLALLHSSCFSSECCVTNVFQTWFKHIEHVQRGRHTRGWALSAYSCCAFNIPAQCLLDTMYLWTTCPVDTRQSYKIVVIVNVLQ